MLASANGHSRLARLLIDRGAKTDFQEKVVLFSCPPSSLVIWLTAFIPLPSRLQKDGWNMLMWESSKGNVDTVRALLKRGAALNLQNNVSTDLRSRYCMSASRRLRLLGKAFAAARRDGRRSCWHALTAFPR